MYTYTCIYTLNRSVFDHRQRKIHWISPIMLNQHWFARSNWQFQVSRAVSQSDGGDLRYQFGKPKIKQLEPEAFERPGILPVYLWSDLEFLSPNLPKTCHELLQQRLMWCFLFLRKAENNCKHLDSFRNMDDCQCANLVRRGILVLDGFYMLLST